MKNLSILTFALLVLTSCSMARFTKTATHAEFGVAKPITAVMADLEVSPVKISHVLIPSKTVKKGGVDNVVNCAVQEALEANGNADVLVAIEKHIKYNDKGEVESVVVTGYPAKYVNFRSPGDDYIRQVSLSQQASGSSNDTMFGKLKIKK
jgi:hypothetical protein